MSSFYTTIINAMLAAIIEFEKIYFRLNSKHDASETVTALSIQWCWHVEYPREYVWDYVLNWIN